MNTEDNYQGQSSVRIDLESNPETPSIPLVTGIKSVFPNPFNPSTTILYQLKNPSQVLIQIFNQRGHLVCSHATEHGAQGEYKWDFEAKDRDGNELATGVYLVVMKAGKDVSQSKIVLLK